MQKTLIATTFALITATSVYEAHRASRLSHQNQALQQEQTSLSEQVQQVERERDDARAQLAVLAAEPSHSGSAQANAELLRLRGEVGALRRQTNELQILLGKGGQGQGRRSAADPGPGAATVARELNVPELIVAMTEHGSRDFAELNELIRRGPDAVPALNAALQTSPSWLVPKALGAIQDASAVDPLIAAMAQRQWSPYVEVTVEALESITGQKAGTNAQAWIAWRQSNRP